MSDTTRPDRDDESGFPDYTDDQLDEMLADPCIAYDPVAVADLLDDIARLQGDDALDDPEVIAEAHRLWPDPMDWHRRERFKAIRAGLIPDEPVDDEESDDIEWPDDLAS